MWGLKDWVVASPDSKYVVGEVDNFELCDRASRKNVGNKVTEKS